MPNTTHEPGARRAALLETIVTAQACMSQWMDGGWVSRVAGVKINQKLQQMQASLTDAAANDVLPPDVQNILPLQPNETPGVRGFRAGMFVLELLAEMRAGATLSLSEFHVLRAAAQERLMTVRQVLFRERISESDLTAQLQGATSRVADSKDTADQPDSAMHSFGKAFREPAMPEEPSKPLKPRRSLLEIVLDPRSIQCLLGLGGALMVVGLVILLWINEYFTPPVLAIVLATSNIALLGAGLATIRLSRYQMAGKSLALLSCLVMPLNLWYCHSNDLITIDGHLWLCAVVISALYAMAAVVLRDELFVYVFSAGVAMTGLLILADLPPSPQRFWEIASPATLLVVLGLIGIHLEQAFPVGEGPFSRTRFGMAFFWSGHVQLAAGLLLILGAQVAGDWMYPFWFKPLYESLQAVPSPICTSLRWLGLVLVLAGGYGYVYSDLVVRRRGVFLHVAAFTLLWAEVLTVQILELKLGIDAIIAILAATSLLSHLAQSLTSKSSQYTRTLPVFGLLLGILPVLMGIVVYLDHFGFQAVWVSEPPRWAFVGAMLLTAVACRTGAYVYRAASTQLITSYFFATGAATMVAAVAALAAAGLNQWQSHAPIMMLIPLAYLIAAQLYRDRTPAQPLLQVAHAASAVMLISSLASAFQGFGAAADVEPLHLPLALFFAEAATFYGLATYFRRQPWCVYLSSLMAAASFWQLLTHFDFGTQAYILAFAVIGLLMLIAYRFSLLEQTGAAPLAEALFQSANAVLSLAFASSVFYGLSRFLEDGVLAGRPTPAIDWGVAGFSLAMLVISLLAIVITAHPVGRRWYSVASIAQGVVTLLTIHNLIDLNPWQQVELFAVLTGCILLTVGHIGWYREQDQQSDVVSLSLMFGAVLSSVPLAIATWIDRSHNVFYPVNEFGFLFVSVALLATGVLFQLKATTMVGSVMTTLYFVTLMMFVPWGRLNSVAMAITIGGGVVFGSGLILALFRDRLMMIPERIQRREGVFRVFGWR